jgi:hypothetical protein
MTTISFRELESGDPRLAGEMWTTLEHAHGQGGLVNSWDWTRTWIDSFGSIVPHTIVVGEIGSSPVGVALITRGVGQKRGPVPVRTIHLGASGEPPESSILAANHRVLVNETYRELFSTELLQHIRSSSRRWDELVLHGYVVHDVEPFCRQEGHWHVRRHTCRVNDLRVTRDAGADVLESFGKKVRKNVRRSLRALPELTTEYATTVDHGLDILDELIELHQRRWTAVGQPGAFASPRSIAFHRLLVERLMERQAIFLFRVREGGRTIGCKYGFIENNSVLSYQSGILGMDDPKFHAGLVNSYLSMKHAQQAGIDTFNLGLGDYRYKQEMANSDVTLIDAVLSRPTPKQLLIRLARKRRFGSSAELEGKSPEE